MIERRILIGLITSTEFCQKIARTWNVQLLESPTARRMATWCWEHYQKYDTAPGRDIEIIYHKKLETSRIPRDLAEEIENDILPSLSEEYEREGVNTDVLIAEANEYFNTQHLKRHVLSVETMLKDGEVSKAEQAAAEFRPLGSGVVDLEDFTKTIAQMRRDPPTTPEMLMRPWLRAGQTTILYGNYGSGKSLLTIAVAYVLGVRRWDRQLCEIGEWQVKNPTGTLYIDGELGQQEMIERIGQFEWLGPQLGQYRMRVLSLPEYQLATEDSFYLSDRRNQLRIVEWLKTHTDYRLVVLDSVSTLFGLLEENDNSEWNTKINPFLRDLRALGVACLLLHHAGKDNKKGLRGASAMGAMAHNIFRLTNHKDKDIDDGEAWFVLDKDKQRSGGFSFKRFGLRFEQNPSQTETRWEVTDCGE